MKYNDHLMKYLANTDRGFRDLIDPSKPAGFVYILQMGDTDYYKIGMTKNLQRRKKEIQRKSPLPVRMIHWWWGHDYRSFELFLHEEFDQYRRVGEWFKLSSDELAMLLRTCPDKFAPDDPWTLEQRASEVN